MNLYDEIICCIYPTAPLMRVKDLRRGFNSLIPNNYIFSANKTEQNKDNVFNIKNNKISKLKTKRNSIKKKIFIDSGQFYWATADTWLNRKRVINLGASIIQVPKKYAQDLNNYEDLKILKKKFVKK